MAARQQPVSSAVADALPAPSAPCADRTQTPLCRTQVPALLHTLSFLALASRVIVNFRAGHAERKARGGKGHFRRGVRLVCPLARRSEGGRSERGVPRGAHPRLIKWGSVCQYARVPHHRARSIHSSLTNSFIRREHRPAVGAIYNSYPLSNNGRGCGPRRRAGGAGGAGWQQAGHRALAIQRASLPLWGDFN